MLTFTFLSWLKQERSPFGWHWDGTGREIIPRQTSSFLCEPWRWYADLAVGWHLKVVNCANLCFRLERSWIVRVFHHELTPPSTFPAQHSCRLGREVCWFLRWPPYSCPPFFKVVHEYLYAQTVWKMKINLQLTGRWLGYLFSQKKTPKVLFLFKMRMPCFIFPPHSPERLYIKLGMLSLIREHLTLLRCLPPHIRAEPKQFRNVSLITFVGDDFTVTIFAMHSQRKHGESVVIMVNRFITCKISFIFRTLPSNRQRWWESTINWRYSRCTDWKFYTWFHLNSTNGSIIAPFHHFPSLDDIKESSLRGARKDEYIQPGTWTKLKSDHVYFCLSFTFKKTIAFDLMTISVPLRIHGAYLLAEITLCMFSSMPDLPTVLFLLEAQFHILPREDFIN